MKRAIILTLTMIGIFISNNAYADGPATFKEVFYRSSLVLMGEELQSHKDEKKVPVKAWVDCYDTGGYIPGNLAPSRIAEVICRLWRTEWEPGYCTLHHITIGDMSFQGDDWLFRNCPAQE